MKHHIIVKWNESVTDKNLLAVEVKRLFDKAGPEIGVNAVNIIKNCIDRENRYDLMIVLDINKNELPVWDSSPLHKEWKEEYGGMIAKKAIFDSEDSMREVRRTRPNELEEVLQIYAHGREIMKRTGNVSQWGDNRPPVESIRHDIEVGDSYVVCENGEIHSVFAFIQGPDPTYAEIRNGEWPNDKPYWCIHRIASDEKIKGVLRSAIDYASKFTDELRIDTHENNTIMRHLIMKNDFKECGIITTDDGTDRIAFQKHIERE